MAGKSGAERQRAYRARQAEQGDVVRVSFDLPWETALHLRRLARHHGDVPQLAMLVKLIEDANRAATADMDDAAFRAYVG